MRFAMAISTLVVITTVLIVYGEAVSVFQFFDDIPESILNFFVLDCEPSSLNEARNVFDELRSQLPGRRVDIVTVPLNQHELKPLVYTKTIDQMAEALDTFTCSSNLQEDPPTTYDTPDSVILSLIPQLHPRDGIILFGSLIKSTKPSLSASIQRKLKPKGNQIHLLHRENTHISDEYQDLIRLTWGQVITYGYNDRVSLSQLDDDHYHRVTDDNYNETHLMLTYAQPNYKISVTKHQLQQDTRTDLTLPSGTFRLFINIHGTVRKALLLSSSGISINLLPIDNDASRLLWNRTVNFDMAVLKSPSSWTLSCNGERYNVTVVKLRNYDDHLLTEKSISVDRAQFPVALKQRSIGPEPSARRFDFLKPHFHMDGQFDMNNVWYAMSNDFPTSIDVDLQSTFFLLPGEMARILLQVRNNKPIRTRYYFDCVYPQQPCEARPRSIVLIPGQTVPVELIVRAEGIDDSSNIVTFICKDIDIVHRKIYLFIGRQRSDTTRPDIGFEYNGNCDDANTGNTCNRKRWSVELYARDTGSGLLGFWSEPSGLYYTAEFIVGTRDPVTGRYSASCCETKVDILAMDLKGNVNKIVLDVEHQYLNWVEISAIVLAALLVILLVALIIFLIVRWRRKRNEMSFLNN